MFKYSRICSRLASAILILSAVISAQEFPVATGRDTASMFGGGFDGTKYLIGIQGDTISSNNFTAQLVSTNGGLIGSRISFGLSGGRPFLTFDGTNYLMVWNNSAKTIVYGQILNASGILVGTAFVISNNAAISSPKGGRIAFGDSTYMVIYKTNDTTYGQRVSKSGSLLGSPARISGNQTGDNAMAFDGTNYLVAWWAHDMNQTIYGQFISKSGTLVGSNFVIDNGQYASDNPLSIAFDGARYLVCFHEQAADNGGWNLFARFVTASGIVSSNRITLRDSTKSPGFPNAAFDGTNYLITWTDHVYTPASVVMGRFFNTSGVPMDTAFTVFGPLGGKVPFNGGAIFANNKYAIVTARVDTGSYTNGDVYGKFIQPLTTGINNGAASKTRGFSMSRNHPNSPINISFTLTSKSDASLKVYDVTGKEVSVVFSERLPAGTYLRKWNASNFSNGIYFCRFDAGAYVETKMIFLLKQEYRPPD